MTKLQVNDMMNRSNVENKNEVNVMRHIEDARKETKIKKNAQRAHSGESLSLINQKRKWTEIAFKVVVTLLLVGSLLCYLAPFVTVGIELPDIPFVSLDDIDTEIVASGYELATGAFRDETMDILKGLLEKVQEFFKPDSEVQEIPLNLCATIAMGLTIIALLLSLIKKTNRIPVTIVALLAAASLIAFRYTFIMYYKMNTEIGPFNLVLFEIGPFRIDSILQTTFNEVMIWMAVVLDVLAAGLALIKISPIVITDGAGRETTPIEVKKEKLQNSLQENEN